MNKTLKETREMKDSGIQWIGEIPKTWQLPLLGSHFKERSEKVNDKDFPPLSVTKKGVVPQLENVAKTDNNDNRKKICINDFVINSRSDRKGSSGLSKYEGSTSNISIVLKLKDIFPMYAHYLLKSQGFTEEFYRWGSGIVADLWSTRYSSMKKINIPLPPFHEQQAIANYLDEQVEKIDTLIVEQKVAMEKWKAYKQSLITETVTKGLNPNVEMKDSGIEWIGEIPKVWEINKIKHCCYLKGRIGWQGLKSDEFIDDGPFLVTGTDFKNGVVNWETCRHISMERYEEAFQIQLKNDDMLVTKDGTIGKVALVKGLETKASLNSGVFLVRNIKNSYATKYLYYVMLSEVFWKYFKLTQNGSSTIVHLYQEIYKEFSFPFPEKHIQQAIADYLYEKCSKIDQTIEQKQHLIKQLEEYKQSLIYECVTGKRCVL